MLDRLRAYLRTDSDYFTHLPEGAEGREKSLFPGQAQEAAVLLAFTDGPQAEIILTKRAKVLAVHGGEVSFPGGMWEPHDIGLEVTALREAHEEIALEQQQVELLAGLSPSYTRAGTKVTPFVGIIPSGLPLKANPEEIEAVFSVPLDFFLSGERSRTDCFRRNGQEVWVPAYHYQHQGYEYEIWGFTAGVLVELLNRVFDANITAHSDAPVRIYD